MGRLIPENLEVNHRVTLDVEALQDLSGTITDSVIEVIVVFTICSIIRSRLSK